MTCVHYYIATAETSAVTSVEEESHEDSTAMIAPTSDMSSRDEGTGKQLRSYIIKCMGIMVDNLWFPIITYAVVCSAPPSPLGIRRNKSATSS